MTITTEQLSKLPVYARREIERLTADLAHWKAQATDGPEDSDTFVDRIIGIEGMEGRPIGTGTRVLFQHGAGDRQAVEVHVADGAVQIRSANGGDLIIQPLSTNTCRVLAIGDGDFGRRLASRR